MKRKGEQLKSDALIASGSDALFDAIITIDTEGTICYPAGYLNLTKEDVTEILKESM